MCKRLWKNKSALEQIKGLVTALLLCGISANSFAALMTFNDQAAFQSALGSNPSTTINFDNVAVDTPIVDGSNFQGIDFSFIDGSGSAFDGMVGTGFDATSGNNYLGYNDPAANAFLSGDSISMSFSQTIHAIGMYIIASPGDILFPDDAQLIVGNDTALLDPTPLNVLPDGGEVFFLGLINTNGFTMADLTTFCCGFFEFNVDDIQFSTFATPPPIGTGIPEPAHLSLFALALLIALRKRKM